MSRSTVQSPWLAVGVPEGIQRAVFNGRRHRRRLGVVRQGRLLGDVDRDLGFWSEWNDNFVSGHRWESGADDNKK